MHHPSLQDIILVGAWAISSVGIVYLSGYMYRTSKRHTEYNKLMRRVVIAYWALFCVWQACLALHVPALRSMWVHFTGPLLITGIFLLVILFPLIQARMKKEPQKTPD